MVIFIVMGKENIVTLVNWNIPHYYSFNRLKTKFKYRVHTHFHWIVFNLPESVKQVIA